MAQTFNPDNVLVMDTKDGTIPSEQGSYIVKNVIDNSIIMQLAKYEPMTKPVKKFGYFAEGPGAYWVGEAEKIKTSKPKWLSIQMEAKKLGVILPVSKEFLKYSVTDFFEAIKPHIAEAFYKKFDAAAIFGTDTPYGAGISIFERAETAENLVTLGTESVYDDINAAIALVEESDSEAQAFATTRSFNKDLRGARDAQGNLIFNDARQGVTASVLGMPVVYGQKATWDKTKAVALTGDFDNAAYGVLQNIEYAISTDAQLSTITNEDGTPVNLFEQDMFALRATMHIGFMTMKEDAFAAIVPAPVSP